MIPTYTSLPSWGSLCDLGRQSKAELPYKPVVFDDEMKTIVDDLFTNFRLHCEEYGDDHETDDAKLHFLLQVTASVKNFHFNYTFARQKGEEMLSDSDYLHFLLGCVCMKEVEGLTDHILIMEI